MVKIVLINWEGRRKWFVKEKLKCTIEFYSFLTTCERKSNFNKIIIDHFSAFSSLSFLFLKVNENRKTSPSKFPLISFPSHSLNPNGSSPQLQPRRWAGNFPTKQLPTKVTESESQLLLTLKYRICDDHIVHVQRILLYDSRGGSNRASASGSDQSSSRALHIVCRHSYCQDHYHHHY